MEKSIFWSWQSDRDARVTRNVVREAMVIALDRLNSDIDVEERMELDHDTKGIPGSPDIVTSILEKIDAAEVFVADITPIAVSENGKHLANPNVLIELGYAKKALGTKKLITVWNTAFTGCKVEDLPFDLRGRRGPISYCLGAEASKAELKDVRSKLADTFVVAIGECLKSASSVQVQSADWKPSIVGDPSTWVAPGEAININESETSGVRSFSAGPRWYVRILPAKFDPAALDNGAYALPPFQDSHSWGSTSGGTITFGTSVKHEHEGQLKGATMWFRDTGEIWSMYIDPRHEDAGLIFANGDRTPHRWAKSILHGVIKLTENGGTGPFRVRVGVTGLDGTRWSDVYTGGRKPPISLQSEFQAEFVVTDTSNEKWKQQFVTAWTDYRRCYSQSSPDEYDVEEGLKQ